MVHHHVNWSRRSLKVMMPYLKSSENGEQFLVVDIVVEFRGHKGAGVESNGVDFIVHQGYHGEDGCNSFTLLSRFSLITIELEPDVLINGVLNDSCDSL